MFIISERTDKMKKKILSVLLAFTILISLGNFAFAEESDSSTYVLTLDEAIKLALANDPAYKNFDSAELNAQKQLDKAYRDQRELKGAIRLPAGIANVAVKQGYYIEQAKIAKETTKRSKLQYESKTAYLITQAYYNVKLAEDMVETTRTAYELALKNKKSIDLQFSLGMVSQLDVNKAGYSVNETKAQLDKNERTLALAIKSFASSLFVEETDAEFKLTDEIVCGDFKASLTEDTAKAIDNRLDLYQLKSVYSQAEKYTKVTALLGQTSAQHSDAVQSKLSAETNYKNAVRQTDIFINSTYNSVLDAYDALKLAEENYSIRKQEYDISVIQYDIGMITNEQLISSMNFATSSKIQLDNAKLTYKLAVEKYNYEIAIGLGI